MYPTLSASPARALASAAGPASSAPDTPPAAASAPNWRDFAALPRAHGPALVRGQLRTCPEDFRVDEMLAFGPDGDGEHALLRVRKRAANTEWVARRLAALAGVSIRAIGYAGLKDRHAIATQWFSVHLGKAPEPRWQALAEEGIEVLEVQRHRRKLRRGLLAGNRFEIRLCEVSGDLAGVDARLAQIAAAGVPNYFGAQRFGRAAGNLHRAEALFQQQALAAADPAVAPPRVNQHLRGLWLSAVRSQLFNEVLARRVARGDWDEPLPGERLQLFGSQSHFLAETIDQALRARVASGDVRPTGPLFGGGPPLTGAAVAALEQEVAAAFPSWLAGLAATGLRQERRALRLDPEDLRWEQQGKDQLLLRFTLPAGSYATVLLRELATWTEPGAD